MSYNILKIPVNREKAVFYYYKPYVLDQVNLNDKHKDSLVDIPASRSIYLCHFARPIEEEFIQKFFGQVGKIQQMWLGVFKNKGCNKRKRRTIYYGIITFKKQADCDRVLADTKLMQTIVNKTTRKQVRYLNTGEDEDEEEAPVDEHKAAMQDGGFTLVEEGDDHLHAKKKKTDDGNHTTMAGIKQEHAQKILNSYVSKGKYIPHKDDNDDFIEGSQPTKRQKVNDNKAMYGMNVKDQKKQELLQLREDFDKYKRQMEKIKGQNVQKEG